MRHILPGLFILILISCGKKAEDTPVSNKPDDTRPEEQRTLVNDTTKTQMLDAINAKSISMVNTAIEVSDTVDYLFIDGETPITKSIRNIDDRNLRGITFAIIRASKNINMKNKFGNTPLNLAIKLKRTAVVDLLIELKADVNKPGAKGRTPLVNSILYSPESTGIALVKRGADFNAKTGQGYTIEQMSRYSGLNKLSRLIHKAKNHTDTKKENIVKVINDGDTSFLDYLIVRYPEYLNIIDDSNLLIDVLALNSQVKRNNMLNEFLKLEINLNNTYEIPPLHYTIVNQLDEEFNKLILNGAEIDLKNENGLNALDLATSLLNIFVVMKIKNLLKEKILKDNPMYSNWKVEFEAKKELRSSCGYVPSKNEAARLTRNSKKIRSKIMRELGCFN